MIELAPTNGFVYALENVVAFILSTAIYYGTIVAATKWGKFTHPVYAIFTAIPVMLLLWAIDIYFCFLHLHMHRSHSIAIMVAFTPVQVFLSLKIVRAQAKAEATEMAE